jgi:misacylated tRNA(Ala) deacylase
MHTACHVLSSVFVKEVGALITGNQLDLQQSRVDFNLENFDREKIQQYINKANDLLATHQEIAISFMPRAEAEKIPELAKLAMGLKQGIEEIRVITIGNIDTQADGGTHVKNTKEVGTIELIKCENKGKANRRVYFTLK